jgi:hypothetical protein
MADMAQSRLSSLALATLAVLAAVEADARIIERSLLPLSIFAGGHCDRTPDEQLSAPGTPTGKIDHNFRGFDFVIESDILPPAIGLGFAVRVKLPGYGPGKMMTIHITSPDGDLSVWQRPVPESGFLEVGRLPMRGRALPEGRYILKILDGQTLLIAYDFVITGGDTEGLCIAPVS